ncbi:MAG: hypothetical protein NT133_03575 [Alphaproteobacteria bacterium]|nr:hypothetical protein [Alphaproteobacteria bacterium]
MSTTHSPERDARPTIKVAESSDGTLTYQVALPPEALPPVRPRDLDAAWQRARAAALAERWGKLRLFRFIREDGTTTDLALADPDAACWAEAADLVAPLASTYGMSLCLRLLALVTLLGGAGREAVQWTSPLFTLHRDGAEIAPVLLNAAAQVTLNRDALFDPDRLRARLATQNLLGAPA